MVGRAPSGLRRSGGPDRRNRGEGSGEGNDANPRHRGSFQRPSRRRDRGSRGQDVVDQNHRSTGHHRLRSAIQPEGVPYVRPAGPRSQRHLGPPPLGPLQRWHHLPAQESGQLPGQETGLVVPPAPAPAGRGRDRDQARTGFPVRPGTSTGGPRRRVGSHRHGPGGGNHATGQDRGELPPSAILQRMDQGIGRRLEDDGGGRRPQDRGPGPALEAVGSGPRARAAGVGAPGTPGVGRLPKTRPAPGAEGPVNGPPPSSGKAPAASQAAEREDKLQEARPPGSHGVVDASMAPRMASTGADRPHQRSKAAAPCWISISRPSAVRTPRRRAAATKGVSPPV